MWVEKKSKEKADQAPSLSPTPNDYYLHISTCADVVVFEASIRRRKKGAQLLCKVG